MEFKSKKLQNEIMKYIERYHIDKTCDIHILLVKYKYNYKAFNIGTTTSQDYGDPLYKILLNGYHILFYSGWEEYIQQSLQLKQNNFSGACKDAGSQLTIDSAGVFKSYDNIGVYQQCDIPDISHLVRMTNKGK